MSIGNILDAYPDPSLDESYSIFLVPLRHQLTWKNCRKNAVREQVNRLFDGCGWIVHPHCRAENGGPYPRFDPGSIFTGEALSAFFGNSGNGKEKTKTENIFSLTTEKLQQKLNPDTGGLAETLLLELDPDLLQGTWEIGGFTCSFSWVDLFLFPCGIGILAFRVQRIAHQPGVSDLGAFHRTVRDVSAKLPFRHAFKKTAVKGEDFWQQVVCDQWLGKGRLLAVGKKGLQGEKSGEKNREALFSSTRYAKMLLFARRHIHDQEANLWDRPLAEPDIAIPVAPFDDRTMGKETALAAMQRAVIAGYPTLRDLLVFELATVSDAHASMGWQGTGRGWQYSLEYIRKTLAQSFVEIWEYWSALSLWDTCAFVSFGKDMPISHQVETRYYPLYLATFYLRLRLERLRREIIDDDMADPMLSKKIKDDLIAFRDRYWFHELTTDFVGREVFAAMKKGMDIDALYGRVDTEVREINEHLQEQWRKNVSWLVTIALMTMPVWAKLWQFILAHIPIVLLILLLVVVALMFAVTKLFKGHWKEKLFQCRRRVLRFLKQTLPGWFAPS